MRKFIAPLVGIFVLQLLLLELILRIIFAIHQDYDMEMWKYNRDLKQNVADARSHVHIPSRNSWLMGTELRINSQGLRNPEVPYKKPRGRYRVLVAGDSFTLGWGVEEGRTFTRILEKKAQERCGPNIDFINAGIGNYNTEQITAALLLDGLRYSPDLILYGFYWNDAESAQIEPTDYMSRHSYLYAFWRKIWVRLVRYRIGENAYVGHYEGFLEGSNWDSYTRKLDSLISAAHSGKVPLEVVLLPELRSKDDRQIQAMYQKVTKYFQTRGVPTLNLFGRLKRQNYHDYWVADDDPHPNSLANAEIAEKIFSFWGTSCPPHH